LKVVVSAFFKVNLFIPLRDTPPARQAKAETSGLVLPGSTASSALSYSWQCPAQQTVMSEDLSLAASGLLSVMAATTPTIRMIS
jgi:hypothetical protein